MLSCDIPLRVHPSNPPSTLLEEVMAMLEAAVHTVEVIECHSDSILEILHFFVFLFVLIVVVHAFQVIPPAATVALEEREFFVPTFAGLELLAPAVDVVSVEFFCGDLLYLQAFVGRDQAFFCVWLRAFGCFWLG